MPEAVLVETPLNTNADDAAETVLDATINTRGQDRLPDCD